MCWRVRDHWETSPRTKTWQAPFLSLAPPPQPTYIDSCRKEHSINTPHLTYKQHTLPHTLLQPGIVCRSPARADPCTFLAQCALHWCSPMAFPLQYALGQSSSKVIPQAWQGASPDREQHHSKVSPALGRGEDTHTNQPDCSPCNGIEVAIWSDCRPDPPTRASQGTTQGKHPAIPNYCICRKHLVSLNLSPK